jgi:glucose-6-phosphate dehydrogenase assembly protein OpcA
MPDVAEISAVGLPVEIPQINRELKKLWEQSVGDATRASLINLAIYSEEPDSLGRNTGLISQITEDHACRALVIMANRAARESRVQAWINAHCHVTRAGKKQVCSEQISFALEGPCASLLPNIVFSHLDSDLPLYLWWQGEFHDPMDPQLLAWVDRLIYDSQGWSDFDEQLHLVEAAQEAANNRVVLCDLNWTRIVYVRLALAQFFDHPDSHRHLLEVERLEIDHAPEYRSTALLLAGWLAAQLGWTVEEITEDRFHLFSPTCEAIEVRLNQKQGEPIGRCQLTCRERDFCVMHKAGADLLEVCYEATGRATTRQSMPAGGNNPVDLMKQELMRGGPHRVYLRALTCVRDLS